MYCGECGEKNKEGAVVCSNCGKKLKVDMLDIIKEKTSEVKEKFDKLSEKDGKTYFNQKKYLSYASFFQVLVWVTYVLYVLGGAGLGFIISYASDATFFGGLFIMILFVGGALLLACLATLILKIMIQNMRWKVDLHNSIVLHKDK